jgi:hypothetical protein
MTPPRNRVAAERDNHSQLQTHAGCLWRLL